MDCVDSVQFEVAGCEVNMYIELIAVTITCLVLWLTRKWYKVKNYWKHRGVPHTKPHFILGSLTFLQKENPTIWIRRLYEEFKCDYVGVWLFWRPALVVNAPELARRVLVKDAQYFRNRFLSSGASDPIGALNIFTVKDPTWTYIRKRLTQAYTGAKLRAIESINMKKANDLVTRIRSCNQRGELFDLRKTLTDYTTDVTGEAAFGVSSEATLTGDSLLRQITRDFMQFSLYRGLCWSSIFFFPELVDVFRFSFFPKSTVELLRKIFRTVVEQRGGFDKEVKECRDLLDVLIKMKQDAAKDGEDISEDLLLSQAAILLFGGFDTSGSSLTWMCYELARMPQAQEILYEELVTAKEQNPGKDFDSSILDNLPYLNATIKETLRKYPPMGWFDRIADKSYKIDDKLTIEAGTVVYVNGTAMHMDPEYFPDPHRFNPERFLGDNEKNIKPFTFMPYGEGPRNCIGRRFANQTMRFAMAAIFYNFKVSPVPGTPEPSECHVETKGFFYMVDEKLTLIFTPREHRV